MHIDRILDTSHQVLAVIDQQAHVAVRAVEPGRGQLGLAYRSPTEYENLQPTATAAA